MRIAYLQGGYKAVVLIELFIDWQGEGKHDLSGRLVVPNSIDEATNTVMEPTTHRDAQNVRLNTRCEDEVGGGLIGEKWAFRCE